MKNISSNNTQILLAIHLAKIPRPEKNTLLKYNQNCLTNIPNMDQEEFEYTLKWAKASNCHIITLNCSLYPNALKEIAQPPIVLFCKGNLELLSAPQVAIVGSRKATPYGKEHAYAFAQTLAAAGVTITSGMAKGIDAYAAKGALTKPGKTIAVLGTGIDVTYPKSNQELQEQVAAEGLLISAFPPGTQPHRSNFPRRNRIISGLTTGVLVVEAELRSGSLITARYALEQNRDVFALPGYIKTPTHSGCNFLIQQGAKLCRNPNDILDEIPARTDTLRLLSLIGPKPMSADQLAVKLSITRPKLLASLVELKTHNLIRYKNGGYIKNYD